MNTFEQVNTKKAIVGLEKAVRISIRESLFWIWLHNLMKLKEIALFAKKLFVSSTVGWNNSIRLNFNHYISILVLSLFYILTSHRQLKKPDLIFRIKVKYISFLRIHKHGMACR